MVTQHCVNVVLNRWQRTIEEGPREEPVGSVNIYVFLRDSVAAKIISE